MGTMMTPMSPHRKESEGCDISQNTLYSHQTNSLKESDDFEKLLYIYQHFRIAKRCVKLSQKGNR